MGWTDPAFAEQYAAATTNVSVVRLDNWTTVVMRGKDRASFLHNMCTNDIRGLKTDSFDEFPVGQQCEAFLTDVKGKIVGHVIVFALPEELMLLTAPSQADALIRSLDRYIIREDVELADASTEYAWGIEVGPAHSLGKDETWSICGDRRRDWVAAQCEQIWPGGSWTGHRLDVPQGESPHLRLNEQVWRSLRIESGWPLFGVDFDGSNLPQEVNRDAQAINFRKGCYLGQETIARIDALGHVNKRLATVRIEGDEPALGVELTADGKEAGRLTSVAWSPRFESWIGFAMLRRGVNDPGAKLACGNQAAEVLPTPAVSA